MTGSSFQFMARTEKAGEIRISFYDSEYLSEEGRHGRAA